MVRKSQVERSGDLEKTVPVDVKPVGKETLQEVINNSEKKKTLEKPETLGDESNVLAESEDSTAAKDNAKRVETLLEDIRALKQTLESLLMSSYKMELTDSQLKELTGKILSVIASFVTDTTVERVEELAGDMLLVEKK